MKRSGRKPNPLNSQKQISDETHIRPLDRVNVEWIPDGPRSVPIQMRTSERLSRLRPRAGSP